MELFQRDVRVAWQTASAMFVQQNKDKPADVLRAGFN